MNLHRSKISLVDQLEVKYWSQTQNETETIEALLSLAIEVG